MMTTQEMVAHWTSESDAANNCIVEILESYMEFINIFEKTINAKDISKFKQLAQALINQRRKDWLPILEHTKKHLDL